MQVPEFLTAEQLARRWAGIVTTGTLANWRSKKVGPQFVKLRGRVLYPVEKVTAWEAENMSGLEGAAS